MHHIQHRRWILSFVIIITALAIATPVLANQIGPKRSVTETFTAASNLRGAEESTV